MTKVSTIYSRLSYRPGTTLVGCGVSAKAHAETARTTKEMSWMLADRTVRLNLSDWAVIVGIACTVVTRTISWYCRQKEREDRFNGNVIRAKE